MDTLTCSRALAMSTIPAAIAMINTMVSTGQSLRNEDLTPGSCYRVATFYKAVGESYTAKTTISRRSLRALAIWTMH